MLDYKQYYTATRFKVKENITQRKIKLCQLYKHVSMSLQDFTLIGLSILGLVYLNHSKPLTDNIIKNDSTILAYVINTYMSLVQSMSRDRMFCNKQKLWIQINHR